jgi:hypothetical protein
MVTDSWYGAGAPAWVIVPRDGKRFATPAGAEIRVLPVDSLGAVTIRFTAAGAQPEIGPHRRLIQQPAHRH